MDRITSGEDSPLPRLAPLPGNYTHDLPFLSSFFRSILPFPLPLHFLFRIPLLCSWWFLQYACLHVRHLAVAVPPQRMGVAGQGRLGASLPPCPPRGVPAHSDKQAERLVPPCQADQPAGRLACRR